MHLFFFIYPGTYRRSTQQRTTTYPLLDMDFFPGWIRNNLSGPEFGSKA
jgi:hypothetical protein